MTTNAQAALVAAATINAQRHGVTANAVTALADRFKTWLDAQEPAADVDLFGRKLNPEITKRLEEYDRESAEQDKPGKVMHPRRCLSIDGALGCKYPDPHRHGFACSKECECNTGVEIVRNYLLDGALPDEPEPEQGEREVQLDALVIPAEPTGPDELHADKRPDSYGDRGESRTGRKRRKGGARGRAESIAEQAVDLAAGLGPGNITVNLGSGMIGFAPNRTIEPSPAMLARVSALNGGRSRLQ